MIDELKKFSAFSFEKPILHCEDCGKQYEPVGYSKKLGWPHFQSPLCPACCEIHARIFSQNDLDRMMKERTDNINNLTISRGAPTDKVLKVKETDFEEIPVGNHKADIQRIVNALKSGFQFLIMGRTDSGKTHLSTFIFKQLLLDLYQIDDSMFLYAYDYKIYNDIIRNPHEKATIIDDAKRIKILFLTFGEYRGAGGFDGKAKEIYREILFNIIDYRIEYDMINNSKYFTTCYITTFDGEDIQNFYGEEFKNRLYEKSYLIRLEQKNYRQEKFEKRMQEII